MWPVRTPSTTALFFGVEVEPLPCRLDGAVAFSVWDLSPAERIAIAEGARIELGVRMDHLESIPAVSLAIDATPREI